MSEIGHRLKKYFMLQIWRLQQSQMIISMIFWALTLTGIFYGYVQWRFRIWFGVTDPKIGMAIMFLIVSLLILSFGFIYDKVFKMWRQQQMVVQERNPYAREKATPKEIIMWILYQLPVLDAQIRLLELNNASPEEIERFRRRRDMLYRWVVYNVKADSTARKMVKEILQRIKEEELDDSLMEIMNLVEE